MQAALLNVLPADLAKLAAEFSAPEIVLAEQQGIEAVLSTTTGEVFSMRKGRKGRLYIIVYNHDRDQEADDDPQEPEGDGVIFSIYCGTGPCIATLADARFYSPGQYDREFFYARIIRWTKKDRDRVLALLLKHKVFGKQGAALVRAILHPPPVSGPMDRFVRPR